MTATRCSRMASRPTAEGGSHWPLERVLFVLAGTVTLLGAGLATFVSPWFLLLIAFVGVNQWLYVIFGACPASLVLRRVFSLRSGLYPHREAQS
jgi:hypothetical protein